MNFFFSALNLAYMACLEHKPLPAGRQKKIRESQVDLTLFETTFCIILKAPENRIKQLMWQLNSQVCLEQLYFKILDKRTQNAFLKCQFRGQNYDLWTTAVYAKLANRIIQT